MKAAVSVFVLLLITWHCYAQAVEVNIEKIKETIDTWSDAHNAHITSPLERITAPILLFQSKKLNRAAYIKKKSSLFTTYENYSQEVDVRDVTLTAFSKGMIKCDFTTEAHFGGNVRKYASYLLLVKEADAYLIAGESDAVTDRQHGYTLNLGDRLSITNAPYSNRRYFHFTFEAQQLVSTTLYIRSADHHDLHYCEVIP